jgi:ankyrin repeat protein
MQYGSKRKSAALAIVLLVALTVSPQFAIGHETDQFTLPQGREFADYSAPLTRLAYKAIAEGVARQNNRIQSAVDRKGLQDEINWLKSDFQLVDTVNRQLPVALFLIEDLDRKTTSNEAKSDYPGRLVGYKVKIGIRKNIENPWNIFRAWNCATIQAFGVYFGTDKVGHFTDMGMHYFRAFHTAREAGSSIDDALMAAVRIGTHGPIYSERGLLGLKTAGAYSNADLVANFMGMCFYRNLTEPVMLKGKLRPPMVVREGDLWKIADHVRPDSDFFSLFFSQHLNEALNPSFYQESYRKPMRKAIREHRHDTLASLADANGTIPSPNALAAKTKELSTYWGVDYGHLGTLEELNTVADLCFAPAPASAEPGTRNDDGLTNIHWAAVQGDLEKLQRLLDAGGDVNAKVTAGSMIPFVGGDTPLHLAAADGHLEVARFLLSRGADPTAANSRGVTPLHRAVGHPELAALLCDAGANLNAADETGRTALHWAANIPGSAAAMKVLLDHRAQPLVKDRDGLTPLHIAARSADADAVAVLLRDDVAADVADYFGVTPLHLAAAAGGPAAGHVTAMLVEAGAQVDPRDDFGVTPLLAATRANRPESIQVLVAATADPNLGDLYGSSPLAVADRAGRRELVELFRAGQTAAPIPITAGHKLSTGN